MTINAAGSAALALALGLRHGLDADHLAAIDGLTRFNMARRREFAPYCGALFSAGHGGAIVIAATLLAGLASAWTPPVWLEWTGKLFSATTLLLLGVSNLRLAVSPRSAAQLLTVTGLRGGVFSVTLRSSRAWQIMLVGALFAVSFDALGLAALFAATATALGGAPLAAALALAFAAGMVITDGSNGAWMAHLARRSDQTNKQAARAMTLTVALMSMLVGTAVAFSCLWPSFNQWLNLHEQFASLLVVVGVLCAYVVGRSAFLPHKPRIASARPPEPLMPE
jgi:nickel/cobalt transporter (NiCoT) family protein